MFGGRNSTNSADYNSSLNEEDFHTNYNTFIKYNKYGESDHDIMGTNRDEIEFESYHQTSSQTLVPLILSESKERNKLKRRLTNKHCEQIITFWIRKYSLNDLKWNRFWIYKYYSCIYLLSISYCIKYKKLTSFKWCNENKSSIIKLLNTAQTFMIHQDKFRNGKNKKIINFKQLNKCHHIQLNNKIPTIKQCNLCCYELEIYQKYLDFKKYDINIYDRKYSALCGSHKIGINGFDKITKKNKYFIGILSYFNYNFKNNKYSKHKQNGTIYKIDMNGNKQIVKNEMALRKHEIIEMKINWISKQLIFNRISIKNDISENEEIIINLDLKDNHLNLFNIDWFLSCNICLNDIDSFMWNDNKDKDFITYTLNGAYIL